MKKLLVCLCAVLLLTSCDGDDGMEYRDPNLYRSENDYEEEYEDEYSDTFQHEENFIDYAYTILGEAEHYAREKGGFSPEEALWITYDPSEVTREEYEEAVNVLREFYEYFYLGKFEDLYY